MRTTAAQQVRVEVALDDGTTWKGTEQELRAKHPTWLAYAKVVKSVQPVQHREEEDSYNDVWPPRTKNSTLRYTTPQTPRTTPTYHVHPDHVVSVRRASLVGQHSTQNTIRQQQTPEQDGPNIPTRRENLHVFFGRWLLVVGSFLVVMLIGWIVLSAFGSWMQIKRDDYTYGRPRTFQIDYNVGHGTVVKPYSHFIALNLNRHIEVIEIPGEDASRSQIYVGPTLLGPGQDLTPVTLSFEGGTPGHPNLVLHVSDSTFLFLNEQVKGMWKFVPAPNQE